MAIRSPSIEIKDCTYQITIMDGDSTFEGMGLLAKYASGPIGELLAAGISKDTKAVMIAAAFKDLGLALADAEFQALAYRMLEGVTVLARGSKQRVTLIRNGDRTVWKGHFGGDPGGIIALVAFALKENFGNFSEGIPGFAGLVTKMRNMVDRIQEASGSPESTTGGSPA